ncbi:unnamed protein product, partial [marine sediment metagenome]
IYRPQGVFRLLDTGVGYQPFPPQAPVDEV